VREYNAEIGIGIQRCEQARDAVRVSLDDRGIVEAIRVPERDLERVLLGPGLANCVDEFGYPVGARVVRAPVDPDVQEVAGDCSNTFDSPETREEVTNGILHLMRRFDQPAREDASLRFWEY